MFTYFGNASTEDSTSKCIGDTSASTNAGMIVHDLGPPGRVSFPQGAIDARDICRDLQSGIWLVQGRPVVALVAIDPRAIQTQDEPLPWGEHSVQLDPVGSLQVGIMYVMN